VEVWRAGRRLLRVAAAHWRPDTDVLGPGLALLEALARGGAAVLNTPRALERASGGPGALAALNREGVPVVPVVSAGCPADLEAAVARWGGGPVTLRTRTRQGRVMSVVEPSFPSARAAADLLWAQGRAVVVQPAWPAVARVVVVAGRVVARLGTGGGVLGPLRGHPARGVDGLAEAAAGALGLDVVGVDVARGEGGLAVEGVTPSPAFHAAEVLLGVDVAARVARAWWAVARGRGGRYESVRKTRRESA
jgi:ribosomal protein S6--L-glutamate ligase